MGSLPYKNITEHIHVHLSFLLQGFLILMLIQVYIIVISLAFHINCSFCHHDAKIQPWWVICQCYCIPANWPYKVHTPPNDNCLHDAPTAVMQCWCCFGTSCQQMNMNPEALSCAEKGEKNYRILLECESITIWTIREKCTWQIIHLWLLCYTSCMTKVEKGII